MILGIWAVASTAAGVIPSTEGTHGSASRWWRHPGAWLIGISALIFVNQILFNVYVIRVHHGDASFISQYVPSGWFSLESSEWMRRFAGWFPWPGALSVTVLRTQASLELPFGLAVYLTVARWFDPALMRKLIGWRALFAASVSYTVVFCLIEVALDNPYTVSNLVVRAISGLVTPLVFGLVLRSGSDRPARSPRQLLTFAASAGALGVLVLVMYDTVLLYNLGRVATDLPVAVAAMAALGLARFMAHRSVGQGPLPDAGPCVSTLTIGTGYALMWFFVPALPIRYELLFGARLAALALGGVIAVTATVAALRQVARRVANRRRWLVGLVTTVLSAVACAGLVAAIPMPYDEAQLLLASAAFVIVATSVAATADRVQDRGRLTGP